MTAPTSGGETLYELLPAFHRVRDADSGHVLRALIEVLEQQRQVLDEDIGRLYDNWFIETCDEWVVPYIADLLAVRGILPIAASGITQRGVVANTIGYRQRKGTAAVLEQLARDVGGWPARVVEFFQFLATNQFMNHVRLGNVVTPDLRQGAQLERIGTAFDTVSHTLDVRHIDNGRGRHNIPNVGLFLWRLQPYPMSRGTARAVPASTPAEEGRYRFSPLGIDAPLFNRPRVEPDINHLALETDVPAPLRRRPLAAELRARLSGSIDEEEGRDLYFGEPPVLQVFLGGSDDPVPLADLAICDLSDPTTGLAEGWRRPPAGVAVGVDPVLGRLALAAGSSASSVEVSYAYGFSGDVGGGPYDRRSSLAEALPPEEIEPTFQVGVTARAAAADAPDLLPTLAAAIDAWNAAPQPLGFIAILDSRSYDDVLPPIDIPADCRLVIIAADWPTDAQQSSVRRIGRLAPTGERPHIDADITVVGSASAGSPKPGALVIDGVLVSGALSVGAGNLGLLRVSHSTIVPVPGTDSISVTAAPPAGQNNADLTVVLNRVISGRLTLAGSAERLEIRDSIVDGQLAGGATGQAIAAGDLHTEAATVLGTSTVRSLHASNTIFTGAVTVERRQQGCVRYSFVPPGSSVPRRFRCQPRDETDAARVQPRFSSIRYGDPAYAQLSVAGPAEIAAMGEDEGEMGAFRFLAQPARLKNIRNSIDEYLRLGLEAGVFLAS